MPLTLFSSLLIVLITTLVVDRRFRRLRARRVGEIGQAARMNYAAIDRFDLHRRLLGDDAWWAFRADLDVKDVLYASADGERCFIFTAKTRRSYDAPGLRRVASLIESTRDATTVAATSHASADAGADAAIYRAFVEEWLARHPDAARPRPSRAAAQESVSAASPSA